MRLRLYESAITSRSVFLRKICGPATFEFCNKIGPQRRETMSALMSAFEGSSGLPERTCTDLSIHGRRARSEPSHSEVHKLRPHTSSQRARLHSPVNPLHSESRKVWPSVSNRKEQTFSSITSDPGPAGRHRTIQSCPCSASIVTP